MSHEQPHIVNGLCICECPICATIDSDDCTCPDCDQAACGLHEQLCGVCGQVSIDGSGRWKHTCRSVAEPVSGVAGNPDKDGEK